MLLVSSSTSSLSLSLSLCLCQPLSPSTRSRIHKQQLTPNINVNTCNICSDHTLAKAEKSLTWSLDYSKYSDFDDCQGHWHLEPVDDSTTRVFYAADLMLRGAVPKPVLNILSKKALKEATGWVKREAEKATKLRRQGAQAPEGALGQN